ncbi:hypothetical protein GIB67_022073 [Kingdonia uniflora]|uniref:Carboxypeptidase n=1 Tax=Kingdonia uniflora TaxID=39325 RepID=A0A7J7MUA8_9MAGN|nr:hypothetical protein GIB67_022073 [Kingdonia uniflora]
MESIPNLFIFLLFISLSFPYLVSAASAPLIPKEALPTQSGYLPISSKSNSSMFYTFYEAQQPIVPLSQTPLLFWLQGGPGCSNSIGNFFELGPWRVSPSSENVEIPILKPNPGPWNHLFGVVFPDNPIGVGFSIASTPEEIPRDQKTVAKHFFCALVSFMKLNPSFRSRPIYITGESYAGKYVPAVGYYILQKNSRLPVSRQVNFGGVAIGNGLTDSVSQNMTGLATLYDLRRKTGYETDLVDKFLNIEEVQKGLGVGKKTLWEDCSEVVGIALHEDVMKSVKFMVEELVKKTRVLLYQGQFDLRDGGRLPPRHG